MDIRDLVHVLESNENSKQEKLQSYASLTKYDSDFFRFCCKRRFSILKDDSKKESLQNVTKILPDVVSVILDHIKDEKDSGLQTAALKALGYLTHAPALIPHYAGKINSIIIVLNPTKHHKCMIF